MGRALHPPACAVISAQPYTQSCSVFHTTHAVMRVRTQCDHPRIMECNRVQTEARAELRPSEISKGAPLLGEMARWI